MLAIARYHYLDDPDAIRLAEGFDAHGEFADWERSWMPDTGHRCSMTAADRGNYCAVEFGGRDIRISLQFNRDSAGWAHSRLGLVIDALCRHQLAESNRKTRAGFEESCRRLEEVEFKIQSFKTANPLPRTYTSVMIRCDAEYEPVEKEKIMSDDFDLFATLRDALQFATGHVKGASNALAQLSDRETLLWSLLEDMAGEVVEVKEERTPLSGNPIIYFRTNAGSEDETEVFLTQDGTVRSNDDYFDRDTILCLARAIQEQRKREVSGE